MVDYSKKTLEKVKTSLGALKVEVKPWEKGTFLRIGYSRMTANHGPDEP